MAPMLAEPAAPRARRQAFVATCSADELLGQVIQTLYPTYNIDAPHLLALRKVLSSAIGAPKKPPQLRRTRPDKRIGQVSSIHNTPHSSQYGVNGPPVTANKSFYFHHEDPEFESLLPQVDRSRYEWPDEPASQEDADSQEVPDSQERMQSEVSNTSTPAPERKVSSKTSTSPTASRFANYEKKALSGPIQGLKVTRPGTTSEQVLSNSPTSDPHSVPNASQKASYTSSKSLRPTSIPTSTITSPDSIQNNTMSRHGNTATSIPMLQAADFAIEVPDAQDAHSAPRPFSVPTSHIPQSSDTQDTFASTQLSEVFTPPADFLQCTPPTQEDFQDVVVSPVELTDASDSTTTKQTSKEKMKTKEIRRSPRSAAESSSQASSPAPYPGKRSRKTSAEDDGARLRKRVKPS